MKPRYFRGLGLLTVRVVGGTLLAMHGAQKLFGAFDGPGLKSWQGHIESMKMKPSWLWAPVAGLSEFCGGILTAAGFLNPLGPLATMAAMSVATRKVHWGKPIFSNEGGAELPLTNIAIAAAVALEGPGLYSLDDALEIKIPMWLRVMSVIATVGGLALALRTELMEYFEHTRLRSIVKTDNSQEPPRH